MVDFASAKSAPEGLISTCLLAAVEFGKRKKEKIDKIFLLLTGFFNGVNITLMYYIFIRANMGKHMDAKPEVYGGI